MRNQSIIQLTAHFSLQELCYSGTAERLGINNTAPDELIPALTYLAENVLEPVRGHFGRPFRPNSGYRSEALNNSICGSRTSQHMKGQAVDIEIAGISNADLAGWCIQNLTYDQIILECYRPGEPSSGWVHISVDPTAERMRRQVLTYSDGKYTPGLKI